MRPGPRANPATALRVVERSTAKATDADEFRSAAGRRAEARKAEKWIDECMEGKVGRGLFEKALTHMHGPQYAEVTHERHLNNLCGYPLCGNPPSSPYREAKRFVVSTHSRTITETQGNNDEAFCSRKCATKSNWVVRTLSGEAAWLRSGAERVELLEELEEKGVVTWKGRRGDVLAWADGKAASTASTPTPEHEPQPEPELEPKPDPKETKPPPPQVITLPPSSLPGDLSNLVTSLSIVERATPKRPPSAPSKDPQAPAEQGPLISSEHQPLPLPADIPNSSPRSTIPVRNSARSARRTGALALAGTERIGAAVLDAAKGEESDDESASEEEWAKEMGWGEGEEVDALFEEARRALELGGG